MFEEPTDPLLLRLVQAQHAAALAWLEEMQVLADLWRATPQAERELLATEVALALDVHERTAGDRLGTALRLAFRPTLRAALRDGRLGVPHVLALLDATASLDDGLAAAVDEDLVVDGASRLTPSALARRARRRAVQLDPAAADRRRERARATAGVRCRPLPDGMAALTAFCTAEQALTAERALEVLSRRAGTSDARSADQRRVDALLGAVLSAGGTAPVELHLRLPVRVPVSRLSATGLPDPVVVVADLPALAQALALPLPGPVPVPAELVGHGPLAPAHLAALLPDARVRRVLVDQRTGRAVAVDGRAGPPLPPTRRLDAVTARDRERTGSEHATGSAAWLAAQLPRLLADLPAPPPSTAAYRPTRAQARLVRAASPRCAFPGCSRPSSTRRGAAADLDHLVPHPRGETTVSNLHPLCRRHHRVKQSPGWSVLRTHDGTTTWTSPRGQVRQTSAAGPDP